MAKCFVCSKDAKTLCAYCNKPFYCSLKCKEIGEDKHIFDCHPDQLKSADYLTRAVWDDAFPANEQTLKDYGFVNCKSDQEFQHLFGLYVGLIKILEVPRDELHEHCMKNKLADLITKKHNQRKDLTSFYYEWFLLNQHVVTNENTM